MKTQIGFVVGAIILFTVLPPSRVSAQSVAFTYQGQLNDGVNPANGTYDLQFTLYNSTNLPGAVVAGPITNSAAVISNGLFTANIDFGTNVFTGADRWLEIGVRTNGAALFTTVSPRQKITPAPYALTATYLANVVANNTIALTNFATVGGGYGNAALGFDSTVGGGAANSSLALYATIAGGGLNSAINTGGTIGGGYVNTNSGFMGTIAGGWQNLIIPDVSTISGGYQNTIETNADNSTISGGSLNLIQTDSSGSVIAGGTNNTIQAASTNSVIGGGIENIIVGSYSTIAGGRLNDATNRFATVAGGELNIAGGDTSTIGGGDGNLCLGILATVGGGQSNISSNYWTTVGGGRDDVAGGNSSTVAGGFANRSLGDNSTIGGGLFNFIGYTGDYSFIGGGQRNQIVGTLLQSALDTIGGGGNNTIQTNAFESTIGGGGTNTIQAGADTSTIGGGHLNTIQNDAYESVIGGGYNNLTVAGAYRSTIGGGFMNTNGSIYSTVGGGFQNAASGGDATVGGGAQNVASGAAAMVGGGSGNTASGSDSTASGGAGNIVSGYSGTVGGGVNNQATSLYSTVPGGLFNVAGGQYSFAAGQQAQALHQGTFVWADSQSPPFTSTANNQFLIRAQGGVGIGTANPQAQLNVNGNGRIEATNGPYTEGLTLNLPPDMGVNGGYGGIHFHSVTRGGAYSGSTIKWGIFYNYAPELGIGAKGLAFVETNSLTRLYISTNGNVGIGTPFPDVTLSVNGSADKPGGGSWGTFSDSRLKDVGAGFTNGLESLDGIQPVYYHYKADNALNLPAQPKYVGVVAQQVQQVVPDAVERSQNGYLVVNNDPIFWTVVNAVKDLNRKLAAADVGLSRKLDQKETEIADLKLRNESLERRLNVLENIILNQKSAGGE